MRPAHHRVLNPSVEQAKKRREKFCKPTLAGVVGRQFCHVHRCHTTYANYENAKGQVLIVLRVLYIMSNLPFRLSLQEFSQKCVPGALHIFAAKDVSSLRSINN